MSNLQNEIIQTLYVKPEIHAQTTIREIIEFLKEYLQTYPFFKGFVLGISGGQDSTLVGKLAQMAINEMNAEYPSTHYRFVAVKLPYGVQQDQTDVDDAIEFIQPDALYTINIKAAVDASVQTLADAGIVISDFTKGNEKARERMKAQYSIGATEGLVVLGTDHAAELLTGFFTKHGDGASDVDPIVGLNKRQGRALLQALNCPEHLYLKIPTADLEENRPMLSDEEALGVSYDEIDDYLEGKQVAEKAKQTIEALYRKSEHKRHFSANRFDQYWKR